MKDYKYYPYIYGPVYSRRLGYSLGLDVIPLKTCSFDCIFCELHKRTDNFTTIRKPYIPKQIIMEAISEILPTIRKPLDSLTFSGSGEPTLNSEIGEIILFLKNISQVPVTVFTNSTLLHMREVREELAKADRVKCTLSSVTPELFNLINRPATGITPELVIEGIKSFSENYAGELWLEIMIIKGINDKEEEMRKIYEVIKNIPFSQIHLNRPVRASAEQGLETIEKEDLEALSSIFFPFKVTIV